MPTPRDSRPSDAARTGGHTAEAPRESDKAPPETLRSVCVFCGASAGARKEHAEAAAELGRVCARRGIKVVYGAGGVGLMGALSDAALAAGGEVIGVIPRALMEREYGRRDLTELHVVDSMHQRKALMHQLSDAFIALPGGYGTLEELFEITAWAQLGLHRKPVVLLDGGGFFDPLARMLDHARDEGFITAEERLLVRHTDTVEDALRSASRKPPADATTSPVLTPDRT
ncbi:TIGR00730 family Rossman fold protein [Streptomyces albus]|uniref:LOG family protein n=1 Tax=Streptomyces albus TaxID=1888 RepID=UPI0036F4BB29